MNGLEFEFPRPPLDLREVHWDGNPEWELEETIWAFGLSWEWKTWQLDVGGGFQHTDWRDVRPDSPFSFNQAGIRLGPTPQNPDALWPTSAPTSSLRGDECNVDAYQLGVLGGCIADLSQTRAVSRRVTQDDLEYRTLEIKLRSDLGGPVDFLLGGSYAFQEVTGVSQFLSNTLDSVTFGDVAALLGAPNFYPGPLSFEKAGDEGENFGVFLEAYWQVADRVRVTAGARYNHGTKRQNQAVSNWSSLDANDLFGGGLGQDPFWIRQPLASYLTGAPSPQAEALAQYFGATDAIAAANGPVELVSALQLVPPVERPGEFRELTGRPDELEFKDWSGRLVVDWQATPGTLLYAKYDRGFKTGGFGSFGAADFDSEIIDSFEIGAKMRLLDDTLSLNTAAFTYQHKDAQVIPGGTQFATENTDVDGRGIELELMWVPVRLPDLTLSLAYGWLDTELRSYSTHDNRDPRQGNADYVDLNLFGRYIARVADVLPLVDIAVASGAALPAPGTVHPNGIPVHFDRSFLEAFGVETLDGIVVDLSGNRMPHAPEHTVSLGVTYSWYLPMGTLTGQWDYHWQAKNYVSVINAPLDTIDAWGQHNATLTFEDVNERWAVRLWGRNIGGVDDNLFDKHGRAQLVFGEPRIFGVGLRFNLGQRG